MTRRRGWCGNDPRAQLTDQDRATVAKFRAYLLTKKQAREQLGEHLAAAGGTRWRVFVYDAGQWRPTGPASDTRDDAEAEERALHRRDAYAITQIVSESTTYRT